MKKVTKRQVLAHLEILELCDTPAIYPSHHNNAVNENKKRQEASLEDKVDIIETRAKGESCDDIARHLRFQTPEPFKSTRPGTKTTKSKQPRVLAGLKSLQSVTRAV